MRPRGLQLTFGTGCAQALTEQRSVTPARRRHAAAPDQRADRRRGRLLPGLGTSRRTSRARSGPVVNAGSSTTCSASWPCSRSTGRAPLFSPWAGSLSAIRTSCARSSPAAMNWPATATATSVPATSTSPFPRGCAARQAHARRCGGRRGAGLPGAELLDRQRQLVGLRHAGAGRLSLQLQHLPDCARPLRHARLAALRLPRQRAVARDPRDHAAHGGTQPALQRRGLLPSVALRRVALDAATCERRRRRAGGVLLPPLGDRSGPAAAERHRPAHPIPSLRQHVAMEGKLRLLLADFRWGRMDDIFLGRPVRPLAETRAPVPAPV
jgi:hypothetical protein